MMTFSPIEMELEGREMMGWGKRERGYEVRQGWLENSYTEKLSKIEEWRSCRSRKRSKKTVEEEAST